VYVGGAVARMKFCACHLYQTYVLLGCKLQATKHYCAELVASGFGNDIVLVTDAFDVIVRGPPRKILETYDAVVGGKR
jgi:hypothetical protein